MKTSCVENIAGKKHRKEKTSYDKNMTMRKHRNVKPSLVEYIAKVKHYTVEICFLQYEDNKSPSLFEHSFCVSANVELTNVKEQKNTLNFDSKLNKHRLKSTKCSRRLGKQSLSQVTT